MSTLGDRIREYRLKRGFTQSQMAEKLGMTEANFSSYERNKSIPPGDKLNQIADILNVSIDYLLGRTNDPEPQFEFDEDVRAIAREMQKLDPSDRAALSQLIKSMRKRGKEALDD